MFSPLKKQSKEFVPKQNTIIANHFSDSQPYTSSSESIYNAVE